MVILHSIGKMLQDPYTRLHCEFLDCGAIDLSIAGGAPLDVNRPSTPPRDEGTVSEGDGAATVPPTPQKVGKKG